MATKLPTPSKMREIYRNCKKKYFKDYEKLPKPEDVIFELSNRLTSTTAYCEARRKRIVISRHYLKKFPQDIEMIMNHEMIHLFVKGHSKEFYKWMRIVRENGGKVERFSREVALYHYIYSCEKCDYVFKTFRKKKNIHRYRCPNCYGMIYLSKTIEG